MKKVYKYGTGHEIPEGAVYLCTKVQTKIFGGGGSGDCEVWLVWHYFLVEAGGNPANGGKE